MHANHTSRPPARSLARLVIPFAAAGVVVACLAILLNGGPASGVSVSEVHREIRETVLRRSTVPGGDDGGSVGPWWVSAREVDSLSGIYRDFKLTSGDLYLAAKSAELSVDPDTDMLSFHLKNVVLTRVLRASSKEPERRLHELNEYDLGPVRWRQDIVRDGADGLVRPTNSP